MSDTVDNGELSLPRQRQETVFQSSRQLLALTDEEFAGVDPLVMNLLVAKDIPSLADLDIPKYQRMANEWALGVQQLISTLEGHFWKDPPYWDSDINLFRLGIACQFVECKLDIRYREDQREQKGIRYTNPSDLFLNGVMDTRRGTCANMAALHVALGWRLDWPVSLACLGNHLVCRYDDGKITHNIEATQAEHGGFCSHPDAFLIKKYDLPQKAITCGSELRAVTPRELLGLFIGLRARYERDIREHALAERDYLLARYLFPAHRVHSREQMAATALANLNRFETYEAGHPDNLWGLSEEVRNMVRPQTIRTSVLGAGNVFQTDVRGW
jgi:Transglutaminase-like superfamily